MTKKIILTGVFLFLFTLFFGFNSSNVYARCFDMESFPDAVALEGNCDPVTYNCSKGSNEPINWPDSCKANGQDWSCGEKIDTKGLPGIVYMCYPPKNQPNPPSCGDVGQQCCEQNVFANPCKTDKLECNKETNLCETKRTTAPFLLCNSVAADMKKDCDDCVNKGTDENPTVWTAIGCIETEGNSIVTSLVRIGLGLAGGALLLIILAAAFLLSTSQGDPKKTDDGQKMVTAGVTGLLFIIFSVVILRTIGIDILQIPGF